MFYNPILCLIHKIPSLTLGAHAQRGLQYSVCLSTLILALQATRRPINNTNGFRTKLKRLHSRAINWHGCGLRCMAQSIN